MVKLKVVYIMENRILIQLIKLVYCDNIYVVFKMNLIYFVTIFFIVLRYKLSEKKKKIIK